MTETSLQIENYLKKEYTLTAAKANMRALFFVLPTLLIYIATYVLIWPEQFSLSSLKSLVAVYKTWMVFSPFVLILVIVFGAILHEMLHGYTWAFFCEHGLESIEYGMCWALLTPYCHCQEVLTLRSYVLGGIMPGFLMGLLPAFVGLLLGSIPVFLFGVFFSMAASGDLLVIWMLRHQRKTALVQDHPDKIGCYVFVKA
jgi:hypothetical protein